MPPNLKENRMRATSKLLLTLIGTGMLLSLAGGTARAEIYVVAKLTDYKGETTYHSMSMKDFDAANKWIRTESAFFGIAQRKAENDWKAENEHSYPGRKFKPRQLQPDKRMPSEEAAQKILDAMNEKEAKSMAFKARADDKQKDSKKKKKGSGDKDKEKAAKKSELEAEMNSALPYLQKHLVEMVKAQPGMADQSPPFE